MRTTTLCILALTGAILAGCASAPKEPEVTFDGLVEMTDSRFDKVYRRPDADLAGYSEYGLAPCTVSFRANWLRDQNRSRVDVRSRVSQEDVDRIKKALAEDCDQYFREALLEQPAYNLTDAFGEGQPVLVIRPAIVDLDISAPDVRSATTTRTYTTSSGEMTLSLELVDGTSDQVLVRVVDRKQDRETYRLEWTNSVSNRADARRALRSWSERLRQGLDAAMAGN